MKRLRWIAVGLLGLLLFATAAFVIWAETPLGPMPEAVAALESDALVRVETEPWLVFTPTGTLPDSGLILYPGGRVDPISYAPPARSIAASGYLVVIPPAPLNLAVFSPDVAADVMAVYLAHATPDAVSGLVLWASYPAGSSDFSQRPDFPILSIYGTEDFGLDGIEASRVLLSSTSEWVAIDGGNHAQSGWYGPQPGDGQATISRDAQQTQMIDATIGFLATHSLD